MQGKFNVAVAAAFSPFIMFFYSLSKCCAHASYRLQSTYNFRFSVEYRLL